MAGTSIPGISTHSNALYHPMDWFASNSVWYQWLVRVVVALALVVGYHFFSRDPNAPATREDPGVTLEKDWKSQQVKAMEERLKRLEEERKQQQQQDRMNDTAMYEEGDYSYLGVDDGAQEDEYVNVDPHDALEDESEPKKEESKPKATVSDSNDEPTDKDDSSEDNEPNDDNDSLKEVDEEAKAEEEPPKQKKYKEHDNVDPSKNTVADTTSQRRLGRPPREIREQRRREQQRLTQPAAPTGRPPIAAKSDEHPGLEQFNHWYNEETSLYRTYELGRTDGVAVVTPFLPESKRDQVKVSLMVGNKYYDEPINVFWVDYKGREVPKGIISPSSTWSQRTWLGHPWTFRTKQGELLLHYIPSRIIPSTEQVPTVNPNDSELGMHQFVIGKPHPSDDVFICSVRDPVLPHPPQYGLDTPMKAAQWTLQHMTRMGYQGGDILVKYLTNIVSRPGNTKYRQIEMAQPTFFHDVWNTSARGLLLACGFVEQEAYAELGTMEPLSRERVRDVSMLLFSLEQWKRELDETLSSGVEQPEGEAQTNDAAMYGEEDDLGVEDGAQRDDYVNVDPHVSLENGSEPKKDESKAETASADAKDKPTDKEEPSEDSDSPKKSEEAKAPEEENKPNQKKYKVHDNVDPSKNTVSDTTSQRRLGRPPREIREQRRREQQRQSRPAAPIERPLIAAKSDQHPGLEQFNHWYNVETSLYRMYELGRTDGVAVVTPFLPQSERGHVRVALMVGNKYYEPINVFWVDYKGREVPKGTIPSSSTWTHTTWIGHPWTFRTKQGELLLHYIPYRIIPSTDQVPTVSPNDREVGLHQFVIGRPHPTDDVFICSVHDPVLPHPPQYGLDTPIRATQWTLQHMSRTGYLGGDILVKYLTNIISHPENTKYRQIRTAQPTFFRDIWNTSARGLLLACGFVEQQAYAELGTMEPLSRERIRDVSMLLMSLEQWKREQEETPSSAEQPEGADGYGRAGFGRAGELNMF